MNIHQNYEKLTVREKEWVDELFTHCFRHNGEFGTYIPLKTDDAAERAVEAVAKWVVESRILNR